MSKRDLVSWNAIVVGYAQNGHLCEGLFLLSEMRTTLKKPDSLTVVSLLQACASIGALHQGKWVHNFVIRSCIRPCILEDTTLVDMYSKCGDLKNAKKCFDEMSEQDMVSWGTIISGYGCHGEGKTALKMFSEFLRTGIQPAPPTISSPPLRLVGGPLKPNQNPATSFLPNPTTSLCVSNLSTSQDFSLAQPQAFT
ncbi:pentatricopeptide repeat-containing protein At4g04370-like [Humulus lupulus]|uniref:pentatricopeptide repeat-containing protein At4g04370-like n=1 Tax=Humulus lupulus TaxID=3486 RepID=UPI002B416CEB|nr:pentatricopeptide repeat-containing protein At4g04370-like [Humulus lupulus]